jgi:hypothetical protein
MKSKYAPFLFIVILAGCGGGGGGQSGSIYNPPSMAGTWKFTGTSKVFNLTFTGIGVIQQTGGSLSGELALTGTPCAATATLTGTANGTILNFQIEESQEAVGFVGTASADFSSASGTYNAQAGGCTNGDNGTWTGTKT